MDKKLETAASLCAITSTPLLGEIADRLEAGGDKLIRQVDEGIIFPAARAEAHSHALLMLRLADAIRHPSSNAMRESNLEEALKTIAKRDDWTSGECRHHAKATLEANQPNPKLTLDAPRASVRSEEIP